MAKTQKSSEDLQRLLTPVSGRELDALVSEIVGQSNAAHDESLTPETPLFLQAAEARAAVAGVTVDRLLADYTARLKASRYPTLECLLPDEVQRVSEGGTLSVEQREHVSSCEPCSNLLTAARLSPDRRELLMSDVETISERPVSNDQDVLAETAASRGGTASQGEDLVGTSRGIREVLEQVQRIAAVDANVLVEGETGTGKELVARAIHRLSARRTGPLVAVNCAALPSALLDDELFGHERGAFSGAQTRKVGRLELAEGGTLFLDEVGEVPLSAQGTLLRVLQEREFSPLGSDRSRPLNVRVIAATNRDLRQAVRTGTFREDLYYRICVVSLHVPALRERPEDVPELVRHFIFKHQATLRKRVAKVSREVMDTLRSYPWPGNVRELENVVERALLMASGETLMLRDLPEVMRAPHRAPDEDLFEVERRLVLRALDAARWKIAGAGSAADELGVTSQVLKWRMNRLGIEDPSAKQRSGS